MLETDCKVGKWSANFSETQKPRSCFRIMFEMVWNTRLGKCFYQKTCFRNKLKDLLISVCSNSKTVTDLLTLINTALATWTLFNHSAQLICIVCWNSLFLFPNFASVQNAFVFKIVRVYWTRVVSLSCVYQNWFAYPRAWLRLHGCDTPVAFRVLNEC